VGATIDHIGVPARDPQSAAAFLADVLGLDAAVPDGPDRDMFNLRVGDSASLVFSSAASPAAHHIAFRISGDEFAGVVDRLRARAVPFGNDPEDERNGLTDDPLGGAGRVYFRDSDGHLFEAVASHP
jgi:catechol 2,3-dioxygenase-like lactoylglutathione lyase family enzyme